MVKRSINQKLGLRNFDARNEKIETGAVVTSRRGQKGVERGQGECYHWKAKKTVSRGDTCSFWHDEDKRAKPTPKTAPSSELPTQSCRNASRRKHLRGRSPSGKFARQPCKDYLTCICTKSPCDYRHPPECQLYRFESVCKFGDKCSLAHRQVEGQPSKKPKMDGDKRTVAMLKDVRQLGCVFRDTEPPESLPILRRSTKVLEPIRRVQFSKSHTTSRKHSSKQRSIAWSDSNQKSSSAQSVPPKFEDRSQEEIERQEQCVRGDAWRLAKNLLKPKETDKATFFSPTNEWCLPAPSVIKPKLIRKDLNSAKLETVRVSKSPTTVVKANGEVQKKKRPCMSKNWTCS